MQVPTKQERINRLLDLAKAKTGSDSKTARAIGTTPQHVNNWRNGVSCPIEKQAVLADLAGLNATEVVAYALLEGARTPEDKERVYTALGKNLAPMSAKEFLPMCGNDDLASEWDHFIRCIERHT